MLAAATVATVTPAASLHRFDAYRLALSFRAHVVRWLPLKRVELSDQLDRASISAVLNIAEGAGRAGRDQARRGARCADVQGALRRCFSVRLRHRHRRGASNDPCGFGRPQALSGDGVRSGLLRHHVVFERNRTDLLGTGSGVRQAELNGCRHFFSGLPLGSAGAGRGADVGRWRAGRRSRVALVCP